MTHLDALAVAAVCAAAALCLLPPRPSSRPSHADLVSIVAAAAAQAGGLANVVAVELTATEIRLSLVTPRGARGSQERRWALTRPDRLVDDPVAAADGLTLLRVGRSEHGTVLVNLEAVRTLCVTGDEGPVRALVGHYRDLLTAASRDGHVEIVDWDDHPDDRPAVRPAIVGCPHAPVEGWPVRVAGGRLELPVLDLTLDPPTTPTIVRVREPEPGIRLLGPLELDDRLDMLVGRGRQLVAYLATHRDGVTEERLRTVLWERPPTRGTFNNLISTVRTTLGDIDGEPVLPRLAADRRYRLTTVADSDLDRFEDLMSAGRPGAALGLVRGAVFDEGRLDWANLEGLTTWWERRIADVAHHLSRTALADDDIDQALWATEQGLRAAPGDEQLFRDRMLAWDAAGNPAAVESVMAELCAHLGDADPAEVLHPETLGVYRRCGRGHKLRDHYCGEGARAGGP